MRGLFICLLSILTQVSSESSRTVVGLTGHNVTLPCRYDTQTYGVLSFCWGRGEVPTFKCYNTILSSQDGVVQFREASRYQLLGRESDGDISLTILNAQWSDDGVYGCRAEIPGWFNDYKANTQLVMEEAPEEQTVPQDLTPGGRHKAWTTPGPEDIHVGELTLEKISSVSAEGEFKVGNVARMGAIFFSTLIIILVYIFRRRFQPWRRLQKLNTSAVDNIYENGRVPE